MTYTRHLASTIQDHIAKRYQALILTGPRQAGKTKLLTSLYPQAVYLNCDDDPTQQILNSHSIDIYKQQLPTSGILILDEVQNLSNPGRVGKLIIDSFPNIKLLITGSAGLTIKNKHSESMAGRAISYELYPLTLSEYLTQTENRNEQLNFDLFSRLTSNVQLIKRPHFYDQSSLWQRILLYGFYPALIGDPNPQIYLNNLVDRIIFKDFIDLNLIEAKKKAINLLKLLAHQIGQIVSITELASTVGLDQRTTAHYLTLFQESYLVYLLYPYSQRERDVLSKRPKVYFYDTGIRNALIGNFNNLESRSDTGYLFENFVIIEALKAIKYQQLSTDLYFWRTKQGSEVDLVIKHGEKLFGNEVKWNSGHPTSAFTRRYSNSQIQLISKDLVY